MFWFRKKKTPSGKEKRREPRLEDASELTFEPRQPEKLGLEQRTYYARTINASPGGLKVQSDVLFPVDALLDIRLLSPKTKKLIQATGKVKWVTRLEQREEFEIGLEFVDTPIGAILDLLEHIYKG